MRYCANLVALPSGLKAQVHAVLAKEGVKVPRSDLFGVAGRACELSRAYTIRVESLRDLIELYDREIAMLQPGVEVPATWGWRSSTESGQASGPAGQIRGRIANCLVWVD